MAMQANFAGNIVEDVSLRFTPKGLPVANFVVAVNHRVRGENGEWADGEPQYIRCTAWRRIAENIADTCRRGTRVVVIGSMHAESYETKDGAKRVEWRVTADEVGVSLAWCTAELRRNRRKTDAEEDRLEAR